VGSRGPSRTPTRALALRGSWRSKTRPGEPAPRGPRPRPPEWLCDDAKAQFLAIVRRLWAQGVVSSVDEAALAIYADLLAQYRRASEFVAKHGDVYIVRARPRVEGEEGRPIGFASYPQAKRQENLAMLLLRLSREFGLTPAARTQVQGEVPAPAFPPLRFDYFSPTGVG
jgi:P27 family predicted phage terminase small subunit